MSQKKIFLVFGTRPEAIKMCPLVNALKRSPFFETKVCVTGQHEEMLQEVLTEFSVKPDFDLKIMKEHQDLFDITTNILLNLKPILQAEKPSLVLVHGDTSTTFASALSAFYLGIPIGHVEAGLRTWNLKEPFPEEFNRQSVSLISLFDFCPTPKARENLLKIGKNPENLIITGNTGIDALKFTVRTNFRSDVLDWVGDNKMILLTAHRRENLPCLKQMLEAIKKVLDSHPEMKLVYPAHPNPLVTSVAHLVFDGDPQALIIPPLDVISFHNLMAHSYLVLTDSGGIQEEAPYFGIPVLVLRNVTERPEGVIAGTLKLIGNEPESIYTSTMEILGNRAEYEAMSKATNPYGDGKACGRIVEFLEKRADLLL